MISCLLQTLNRHWLIDCWLGNLWLFLMLNLGTPKEHQNPCFQHRVALFVGSSIFSTPSNRYIDQSVWDPRHRWQVAQLKQLWRCGPWSGHRPCWSCNSWPAIPHPEKIPHKTAHPKERIPVQSQHVPTPGLSTRECERSNKGPTKKMTLTESDTTTAL